MSDFSSVLMPCISPLEAFSAGATALPQEATYPELYYWFWLAEVLGPANANAGQMLDLFEDASAAYDARETECFLRVIGPRIAKRVQGMVLNPEACAARMAECEAKGIYILTFVDPDYPLSLTRIPDPPIVLYCTGDLAVLHGSVTVGMVGTRRPTAYGVSAAARFGGEFARSSAVIVSGLADGLDSECHRAAVSEGMRTIGVMGTPITKTFPAANASLRKQMEALGGLTMSEYPMGYAGNYRSAFLQRNRIIAALSDALVVLEARSKSGTMSTVGHAERYEKMIYAVPGSVFSTLSEGTNQLLHEGRAKMLIQSGDLLGELGLISLAPKTTAPPKTPLSANAKKVLACVGAKPVGVGFISSQSGLAMGAVLSALTSLELSGRIISLPGRQYILK